MVSSVDVKKQLLIANDENSPQEELLLLWQKSRSVKIRKAIAKNPNAGAFVLRQASRLYLEEVLENPGFLMLELFDEDEWIKKVSLAYSNPNDFILKAGGGGGLYALRYRTNDSLIYWAILLSPNLEAWVLDQVIQIISVSTLRRALRNEKLKAKLNSIYTNTLNNESIYWPFSLTTLILLYQEGVITESQLCSGLDYYVIASTSSSKNTYSKYIKKLYSEYSTSEDLAKRGFIVKLILKSIIICKPHVLYWIKPDYTKLDDYVGELFLEIFKKFKNNSFHKKTLLSEHSRYIICTIVTYINNILLNNTKPSQRLINLYNFIISNKLDDIKLCKFGLSFSSENINTLSRCPIEMQALFCKMGVLGSWVSISAGNIKYQIIENVNKHLFAKEGIDRLLYNSCSIRKIISFDESIITYHPLNDTYL